MKAKIILNPSSGKQIVQKNLDRIIGNLILDGVLKYVDVFKMKNRFDAFEEVKSIKMGEYDCIIAVGGDGTVHEVINGVMIGNNKIPIAILPAGTVNDFAKFMNIPTDVKGFCNMIKKNQRKKIDLGKVGDRYFINVLAGGLLTDVGYKVSPDLKTVLGKYAYYVEGMKEIPKQMFKSISLEIDSEEFTGEEDIFMFIVTNTPSVGGFKKIAPKAKIDDGLLDICIIKKSDIPEFLSLFFHTMKGEHIYHPKVLYFQTSEIKLKCKKDVKIDLDVDGEQGGKLPATIEVIPKAIDMIVP
ncbi:YegS/Rv2252/BmrU family lipid kinase [Crassaminicella thermophila]|uniref:YegS/Rv2252/BmrU family lipid kinase n=1 Tax=Crassaminicella thermophila TaxID=2599308 RepID=A0A5C0SG54_CRATE|nr:YegS/Rv2252/BmrU family lipid kinase [Crassaminicella thermophila]QEK11919.1 YegS/Rv2252/BmrU family lipid kinase [Crassaminicella thermophila]